MSPPDFAHRAESVVQLDGERRRVRGSAALPFAALAPVALIAALSPGLLSRIRGGGGGLSTDSLIRDSVAIVLLFALIWLALLVTQIWQRPQRPEIGEFEKLDWRLALRATIDTKLLLSIMSIVALGALILLLAPLLGGSGAPHLRLPPAPTAAANGRPHGAAHAGGATSLKLVAAVLIAIGVLASIVLAVYLVRASRLRRATRESHTNGLVAAVDESLEDLARETDPRRAVIKAYGRMERALAVAGTGRSQAETPLEYLRRALAAVHTNQQSIRRLTDLFEQARFSSHWIDATMKQEAIGALTALRSELGEGGEGS
jgi:hypothetical protein